MMTAAAAVAGMLIDAVWRSEAAVRRCCAANAQGYPDDGSAYAAIIQLVPTCCCKTVAALWATVLTGPYSGDLQHSTELVPFSSGVLGAMTCIYREDELVVWCQLCDMRCALSTLDA
jgi:hypothetical protein